MALMAVAERLELVSSYNPDGLNGAANRLESLVARIERASNSSPATHWSDSRDVLFDRLDEHFANIRREVKRNKGVVTALPARIIVAWKPTFYAFVFGVLLGIALVAYTLYLLNR